VRSKLAAARQHAPWLATCSRRMADGWRCWGGGEGGDLVTYASPLRHDQCADEQVDQRDRRHAGNDKPSNADVVVERHGRVARIDAGRCFALVMPDVGAAPRPLRLDRHGAFARSDAGADRSVRSSLRMREGGDAWHSPSSSTQSLHVSSSGV
jgi:hypothetical protein